MQNTPILGVDVGASGFKGGLVDVATGNMLTERYRFDTPRPASPKAMAATFRKLAKHFDYEGIVGVGFPAVVQSNVARSAANIDEGWIGTDIAKTFNRAYGDVTIHALNDADAAGIATMKFGTGRDYQEGSVLMITIGTGLGSAMFIDGELVPNFELGSLYLKGHEKIAEQWISNRIRKDTDMDWRTFGKRINKYLRHVEHLFNPELLILGGGGSKYFAEFSQYLKIDCEVKPAEMRNTAGTVGAAIYAYQRQNRLIETV